MRRIRTLLVAATLLALGVTSAQTAAAGSPSAVKTARIPDRSVDTRAFAGKASAPPGPYFAPSNLECTVTATGFNTRLDCDDVLPNNEPDIIVDPSDPNHMIASSNDYGSCCDQFYTTFDGGETWATGNMSNEGARRTGSDPVTVFDPVSGHAIHASLNFIIKRDGGACDGDLVVSISKDGGLTWGKPVVVADGVGCDNEGHSIFHDKEWITTDTNPASPFYGRSYVTWTAFEQDLGDGTFRNAIFEAHSDDGGESWTAPQEISGSNPLFCTKQAGGGPPGECDDDQGSVPTIGANGAVHVSFTNAQHRQAWEYTAEYENQYMVVSSFDGGVTWTDPVHVVDMEDGGFTDYPINVNGRRTLTGYQLRVNSRGNMDADIDTGALYLVFSDNRAGIHDTAGTPVTNANVYMMTSNDLGQTWAGPFPVATGPGDEWFPWVDVNQVDGTVGVLYHKRAKVGVENYSTELAQGLPGAFAYTRVSTQPSNPVHSLFFRAGVPGCEECATFHGDYIRVDYGIDGVANTVWTDMRQFREFETRKGYAQYIFFARL